jgi:signal transduction histidine kinase
MVSRNQRRNLDMSRSEHSFSALAELDRIKGELRKAKLDNIRLREAIKAIAEDVDTNTEAAVYARNTLAQP